MATAKRIRCICGKIYDPTESPICPYCGVAVTIERISIVPPPQPKPADVPASATDASAGPGKDVPPPSPAPPPVPVPRPIPVWMWIAGGAVLCLMFMSVAVWGVVTILRPGARVIVAGPGATQEQQADANTSAKDEPAPMDESTSDIVSKNDHASPDPAPPVIPKPGGETTPPENTPVPGPAFTSSGKQWIVEGKGDATANGKELAEAIGKAGKGDTILLRGGAYDGEFALKESVRIVADAGAEATLQSSEFKLISVDSSAQGVVLERLVIKQLGKHPAVSLAKGAALHVENCTLSSNGPVTVLSNGATSLTASKSRFSSAGSILTMRGPTKLRFTDCEMSDAALGIRVDGETTGELQGCKFTNIGPRAANGTLLSAYGKGSSIVATDCEFRDSHAGVAAIEGATLTLKGGSFTGNGIVSDDESATSTGLVNAINGGTTTVEGVTFSANRLGLMALSKGRLEVTDCHFSENGFKTQLSTRFYCNQFGVAGKGASLTVRGSDISRPVAAMAGVVDGGELNMENCKASGGAMDIIMIGSSGGEPCRGSVKKCELSKFTLGAIVVTAGSTLSIEDSELRQNRHGVEARDAGTQFTATNVTFMGNDELGFVALEKAVATATGCTFQDNGAVGVLAGLPGNASAGGATVNLVDCKLYNSRTMDARACDQSRLVLKNCTFAPGAAPQVVRDPTGVVEADPPIQVLASNSKAQPSRPIPANKGTASNSTGRKPYQPPQQQRPVPPKQPNSLPEKVGEVIDAIDKVKRLIR